MCCEQLARIKELGYKVIKDNPGTSTWHQSLEKANYYFASAAVELNEENFANSSKLSLVVNPNTGQDHIDFNFIRSRGIKFITIKDEIEMLSKITATSELAWGLLLTYMRRIPQGIEFSKQGLWVREKLTGRQIFGKKLGILGLGRLGKISARIGLGFGCEIYYTDPFVNSELGKKVGLYDLFRNCEIIFIHTHLNDDTKHMVNRKVLKSTTKKPILVNTSRANIVDEQAILASLKENKIEAYLTDVIDGEWLTKEEIKSLPIVKAAKTSEKILITPHIGGASNEGVKIARGHALEMLMEEISGTF